MPGPPFDTIVALSSGRLPAAIAVIRSSGPNALAAAAAVAGAATPHRTLRPLAQMAVTAAAPNRRSTT